jgi:calcineurin-like phosphoesterase
MKNNQVLRVLCLGDLVGSPGIAMFEKWIPLLKEKHQIDAVIVNGENSAKNGRGIEPEIVTLLLDLGASVITSGNHIWSNKKIYPTVSENPFLLRPANFPSTCPGKGYAIFYVGTTAVAVI